MGLYQNYDDRIKIYHGDMMEELDAIGLRYRHCITDPPYGVQRENHFDTMGRTGCTFGAWDEKDSVVSSLPKWTEKICGLVDENLVIFNDWHNMGLISGCVNQCGFEEKDLLVWKKKNPMPRNTDRRFVPCLEYALWSVRKDAKWTFNKGYDKAYEIPVLEYAIETKDSYNDHPTSKPLQLMCRLVSIFTNEDDLVLDPFGGSGTIAIACHRLNRRLVIIEMDEHYCEIIAKRLDDEMSQLLLF